MKLEHVNNICGLFSKIYKNEENYTIFDIIKMLKKQCLLTDQDEIIIKEDANWDMNDFGEERMLIGNFEKLADVYKAEDNEYFVLRFCKDGYKCALNTDFCSDLIDFKTSNLDLTLESLLVP